jgi:hypothetical protein
MHIAKILEGLTLIQKRKVGFNNISVLTFNYAIMFISIWADQTMVNANKFEKGI